MLPFRAHRDYAPKHDAPTAAWADTQGWSCALDVGADSTGAVDPILGAGVLDHPGESSSPVGILAALAGQRHHAIRLDPHVAVISQDPNLGQERRAGSTLVARCHLDGECGEVVGIAQRHARPRTELNDHRPGSGRREKLAHGGGDLRALFNVRNVAGILDDDRAGALDALREVVCVDGIRHAILIAPDDESVRSDPP